MANDKTELTKAEMELPDFSLEKTVKLYEHDLTIPDELYDALLNSDRKLLVDDLKKLLLHAVKNYELFNGDNVPEKNTFFVWHAFFLLLDAEAFEELPAIIAFLKEDEKIYELYLGDLMVDYGWQFFFVLGNRQLRLLIDLIKNLPDDYTLRIALIEALEQIFVHQPERQLEVEAYIRELLLYVTTVNVEDDFNIDGVAEALLETTGRLGLTRLYNEVKEWLREEKLPLLVPIKAESFEDLYVSDDDIDEVKREPESRQAIYQEYLNSNDKDGDDDGFDLDDDDFDDPDAYLAMLDKNDALEDAEEAEEEERRRSESYINFEESHEPFVKKEPDVGRNEPCPCGSGKKYKKCHGKS